MKQTKEQLINNLQEYYKNNNMSPTMRNIKNKNSYLKIFGTWNNALVEANIPLNKSLSKQEVDCANCGNKLFKLPSEISKTINSFCDQSCAAIYNNKKYQKRKLESTCEICGEPNTKSRKKCKDCQTKFVNYALIERMTYETILEHQNLRKYQKNSRIRAWARKLYLSSGKNKNCTKCGYDKHFEICHIEAISSFLSSAKISEINDIDNLIALCPNCHWELDNLKGAGEI